MMDLRSPWVLFFLPAVVSGVLLLVWRRQPAAFRFSSVALVEGLRRTWRQRLHRTPEVLRLIAIVLFMVALAGPRKALDDAPYRREGVNIMLAVDVSTSMAAEDFTLGGKRTNRLDVIKDVVRSFVAQRGGDRIGLTVFAARPYVACPLTADHEWLLSNLERVRFGLVEDGTAIGSAIASGVNRLKGVEGATKIIVLLTDGVNNAGSIDPLTAARAALAKGVRVYTIGAGTTGEAPYPVTDLFGRRVYQNVHIDVDDNMLTEVAHITGGMYFRATDTASLKDIYARIDKMEKVKFEEAGYRSYQELFVWFLLAGLLVLFIEAVLSRTVFLKIP